MSENRAWSGKTGGTRWMQQSLISIFRHIDPKFLYPIVWICICFHIIFGTKKRQGSWDYWRNRLGYSRLRAAVNLYLNFLEFGKVILDRFAAYSGREVSTTIEGGEYMDSLQQQPGGFIVLSSHIGNEELAGYTFRAIKPMYVLTFMGDTATVQENRARMFENTGLHIIPIQSDGSHVVDMHNALSNGNILSIYADRIFYDSKVMYAPFLGKEAAFPEGPFRVAVAEQVPVLAIFMMRKSCGKYAVYVRNLSDGIDSEASPRAKARALLERYIAVNEEMLRKYPRQWFHFYEFWKN